MTKKAIKKLIRKTISKDKPPDKPPNKQAVKIAFTAGQVQEQPFMGVSMTATQQCTLTATPEDAKGKPAPVDGVPEWQLSNPAICSIQPDPTGLTALVKATAIGTTTVTVIADADLTSGVQHIQGTFDVTVTSSQATQIFISASTPVEQTP